MTIDKRLGELLDLVVKEGGSDLHISAGGSPVIRVAGALLPINKYPMFTNEETEAMLKSIVLPERWGSFQENQTIDLSYAHKADTRFRVNGYRVQGATAIAMRLVPRSIHTFTELNFRSENQTIDLSYAHKADTRFRVNGYRVQGATAIAMRLVPRSIHTFTELNLPSILEV